MRVSLLGVAVAVGATVAGGQPIPRSQLATVTQMVGTARVEIVYRRPVARGRQLFGSLVPWGRVWSPSSDTAARISLTRDMQINGSELAAGTYSLWAIPDSTVWTVIFNRAPFVFHLRYPADTDVLRLTVPVSMGEHIETLTFAFPLVDADSAVLQLRWGTTVVPMTIHAR